MDKMDGLMMVDGGRVYPGEISASSTGV